MRWFIRARFPLLALGLCAVWIATASPGERPEMSEACLKLLPRISEHLAWICTPVPIKRSNRTAADPPTLAKACKVMDEHIADLLNQHRRSPEMDDMEFYAALRLSKAGQSACEGGRFEEGLFIYSTIPIRRVTALLR